MTIMKTFLAASLVALSLSFAACGDVEDTTSPETDAVGTDAGVVDAPTADAGTPDAPRGADVGLDGHTANEFHNELCAMCTSRGVECPELDRFLSWSANKAVLSVEEAADEFCPEPEVVEPPMDPCDEEYTEAEQREIVQKQWTCPGTNLVDHQFILDGESDTCKVLREVDTIPLTFEYDGTVLRLQLTESWSVCESS